MKDMSLGDLLRYGLAGGNFVALYFACYRPDLPALGGVETSAVILGGSLLLGSIVYSLHRALPYPLVFFPASLRLAGYASGVRKFEKERDGALERNSRVQRHTPEWGAQVHFLYALFWSTLLVPFIGRLAGQEVAAVPISWIFSGAVVYLIAGAIHHVRLIKFIMSALGDA